ncbi:leucine-rich repeat-containing protein 74B-like [Saccostrea echinata]|uniref:leucine-rich repeat-containing protein 74B-like n=1 Tax=Saccostrea echinata TaxID=191078 RepID=UPI002A822747|nr:leucine-rich repeat-containing protein 74B-like [Saccostrea echinata]
MSSNHTDDTSESSSISLEPTTEVTYLVDTPSPCSEDFDTDLENSDDIDKERQELKSRENVDIGHHTYMEVCQELNTVPIRLVQQQLKESEICLQHIGLNTNDVIALMYALLHNSRVENLDLTDNGMSEEAQLHVIEVLRHNNAISSLNLSENRTTPICCASLANVIEETTWLTHLNLSGTGIGDDGAKHIATGMRGNVSIVWLNLSHNDIEEAGATRIGKALTINDTLHVLDLSWNHIRMIGAVSLCKGLQENTSITNLNVSWNGLGFEGSIALEDALKENTALKVLDLTNNRITWEGVKHIIRGLKANETLQVLKIGTNPITMDGCRRILEAVDKPESCIIHVNFEGIPINSSIEELAESIAKKRSFTYAHGGVTDSHFMMGIKRVKREDPFTLLIRYINMMGIRIMDLFRMLDTKNGATVSKANFIRGLKKIGAPISENDMRTVAQRLERKGQGSISYSVLANGVRNHIREERKEDKRQEMIEKQKREKRKNILHQGSQRMIPEELQELRLLSAMGNTKTFSQVFSSASSVSSRHGSIAGRESLILPPLQETSINVTETVQSARTFSFPLTSGVKEKSTSAQPRQKIGGSLSL